MEVISVGKHTAKQEMLTGLSPYKIGFCRLPTLSASHRLSDGSLEREQLAKYCSVEEAYFTWRLEKRMQREKEQLGGKRIQTIEDNVNKITSG